MSATSEERAGDAVEFELRVIAVLTRFFRQNSRAVPAAAMVARRLREIVAERGLPPPLGPGECGSPGSMSEEECAPLVARVLGEERDPLLADAVRQLVKACFYPEFTVCRDSYREVTREGSCRRQELGRVRGRVSGTHCVDCPYWVTLAPEEHAEMLAAAWVAGADALGAQREIFLPEDFRALRRWLWAAARAT